MKIKRGRFLSAYFMHVSNFSNIPNLDINLKVSYFSHTCKLKLI